MRIGVVGGGVVGRATARCYMEWAEVRMVDVVPERCTHTLPEVMECDLVFLCLPTPRDPHGGLDLTALSQFCAATGVRGSGTPLVLKSTVPVGTTRRLAVQCGLVNLVHSPEFLTARCATIDAQMPTRNVVGGPPSAGRSLLQELYQRRFPGVPIFTTTWEESELVKLVCNSFFGVKIAFWNEVQALCDARDLDWKTVLGAVLADGRISHAHTRVPGPSGLFGFGGACLPKDMGALIEALSEEGLPASVTAGALERNAWDLERNKGAQR